jgi:hypothetical protein
MSHFQRSIQAASIDFTQLFQALFRLAEGLNKFCLSAE